MPIKTWLRGIAAIATLAIAGCASGPDEPEATFLGTAPPVDSYASPQLAAGQPVPNPTSALYSVGSRPSMSKCAPGALS